MTKAEQRKRAVKLTLPVFCGYIVLGIAFGATLAQGLPFDLTGIDFSMTALFVVICVEKALEMKNRVPMAIGCGLRVAMRFCLVRARFLRRLWA